MNGPEMDPDITLLGRQLTETCPNCLGVRTWSSLDADAVYAPAPGHTVHRTPDGSTYDTCPKAPGT